MAGRRAGAARMPGEASTPVRLAGMARLVDGDLRRLGVARRLLLACLAVATLGSACQDGDTFTGRVVGITDGDTLTVLRDGRPERIRLAGIDAPEAGQPFARRARQHLASLAGGREATVQVQGTDRYGRLVARVVVGDVDVGLEQVRQGLAWHVTRDSRDARLAAAEREARAARRGLWADGTARPPWEHRRRAP